MNQDLAARLNEEIEHLKFKIGELERELSKSRETVQIATAELDAIFASLPDLYFRVDATGAILDYRAGTTSDLYVPPEVFKDKRVQDVLPPATAALYDRAFAEALASRKRLQIEYSLPIAGGEDWFESRLLAISAEHIVLFIRKITAQRRAQTALQELNAELEQRVKDRTGALATANTTLRIFQALADNAPDAIVLTTHDGTEIYANHAARTLFGINPEETDAHVDIIACIIEEPGLGGRATLQAVAQDPVNTTVVCRRRDESTFRARVTAFAIREIGEHPLLVAYVVRDVTREAEAEAERASFQQRIIEAQRATLRELSTPLIPIAERLIAVPLIGRMDPERVSQLAEALLHGVVRHTAEMVLVDVTGVPNMDADVAEALVRVARAIGLLGARLVLTGIRPEVAQTLVSLEVDLRGIATQQSVEQGIAYALGLRQ